MRSYVWCMKVPKEIRHTVGNLRNMVRSAKEATGFFEGDLYDDRLDEIVGPSKVLFLQWVMSRFGLCVAEMLEESDGIIDLARRLQDAPQTQAPTLRRILKQGPPGAPRILLFPGLHGTSWSFDRLARLTPDDCSVIAWDYPGVDRNSSLQVSIGGLARQIIDAEKANGLGAGRVSLFGFCLGGVVAHEVAHQLGRDDVKLSMLDAHPATAIRKVLRLRRALGTAKAMREARRGGWLEKRLVKMGIQQLRWLDGHDMPRADVDIDLIRTGGRLYLGPLDATTWRPFVRSVRLTTLSTLGHADVFRYHHEELVVKRLVA